MSDARIELCKFARDAVTDETNAQNKYDRLIEVLSVIAAENLENPEQVVAAKRLQAQVIIIKSQEAEHDLFFRQIAENCDRQGL